MIININERDGEESIDIVLDTIQHKKQCLVFLNTKKSAEKLAEDIADNIKDISKKDIAEKALNALQSPTKQCNRLHKCMLKGVAFHHSGLVEEQRKLIEENFRSGEISVICSTPTLSYGMDLPAFRVIIRDLKRYGKRGMDYIPVLEYMQMAGRAGRPGKETKGEAICIAKTEAEKDKIIDKFILGKPEEIYSKLAVEPVLRMYVLSLISGDIARTREDLLVFFGKTFWGHQFGDIDSLSRIIDKMLNLLEEYKFVASNKSNVSDCTDCSKISCENSDDLFTSADVLKTDTLKNGNLKNTEDKKIKQIKYTATLIGRRVSQLYLDPLTANKLLEGIAKSDSNTPVFSHLQMFSSTLEMRPLLRMRKSDEEFIQGLLIKYEDALLEDPPKVYDYEYDEYLDSCKTAFFFHTWINETKEDKMLDEYGIEPGLIRVKLEIIDWLLYSLIDLCNISQIKDKVNILNKLRLRLKYGVKEELLPLLKLKSIGRIRARKLFDNGIKDLGDVKMADLSNLSTLLGHSIAADIKKQVDQEIKEIPKGTRKGQLSIEKFS